VATCGTANVEWVKEIGADEVIDYTKTDVKTWASGNGKKVDLVVDSIGRKALEDSWWAVKNGGHLISLFQPPEQMKPTGVEDNIGTEFFIMETNGEQLHKVTELIEEGVTVKAAVDSVWPLAQYQEAFKKLESRKTRGKVVLELHV
jgi:NADPH:quinone reductase-like Zn-dependent oxidoreductase